MSVCKVEGKTTKCTWVRLYINEQPFQIKFFFFLPLNKVSHFLQGGKKPWQGPKGFCGSAEDWDWPLAARSRWFFILRSRSSSWWASWAFFQPADQTSSNTDKHKNNQSGNKVLQTTTRFIVLLYLSTDLCSQHQPFFMLSINPSLCGRAEAGCLIFSGIFNFFLIKGCLSRATWHREKQFEVSQ